MFAKLSTAFASLLLLLTNVNAESIWPQFRGPDGQGHSEATHLPLTWDENTNIAWKVPITGVGWSSPVVAYGKIWLTTATQVTASEADRAERTADSVIASQLDVAQAISLWAIELDLQTGLSAKMHKLFDVESPQPVHSLNSYASPTPVIDSGRLYCHFGDYGTACVDTSTGQIIWQKRLQIDHGVGPGSSPLLYDDLLILVCDGMDKQYVTALHAANGEVAWHTDRPEIRATKGDFRKAFATPLLINVDGNDQVIIPGAQWCVAYEPRSGKEIWRVDYDSGFSNVPCPVYDGEHVFICTGFGSDELWAVRPTGRGDVTQTHVDWKKKKQIPKMSSPLLWKNLLYIVSDSGVAQCFDASTGEDKWKERMGGKYSASPLYSDGKIYFCSHEGRTTVIAPGDEYQVLAENDLDGQLMASPIVADGDLLLRTDSHLYRIRAK